MVYLFSKKYSIKKQKVSNLKDSGLTQSKWCENNNLRVHQLKYWLIKFDNPHSCQESNNNWIPVVLEESNNESDGTLEV
ncbi:IS66 family insertion sequence element accessory protein TnpA [Bacillus andreraoultii]|uniref:IS66 family insertion sequence element accessory protein TnpA n=1 Tax=Bacillus andreraoultii TaxID=1499685 RepID=UPI003899397C